MSGGDGDKPERPEDTQAQGNAADAADSNGSNGGNGSDNVVPLASAPASAGGGTPLTEGDNSPLRFPTEFPIKIMGKRVDGFADAVAAIVREHAPDFDDRTIELRASSKGNYVGLTVTINATSRQQLDDLYRALTGHPLVSVVL